MKLAEIYTRIVDDDVPVAFRAYDGSTAGPRDAVAVLEVRSPLAVRYMVTAPGELGLARAYVTGAVEIHGDLHAAMTGLLAHIRPDLRQTELLSIVPRLGRSALSRPPIPDEEAAAPWRRGLQRHTPGRDAVAISHHYDLSNRFYELVLGPSMTYSCAVFPTAGTTLDDAQLEKVDLICRKLDLQPGQRLLDVGAGWGRLVRHAAEHYGVRAIGVTLSSAQAAWATEAIATAGLSGRAQVRLQDYRDVPESSFDAISSVGAMEHIGTRELGNHFSGLSRRLRPEGRMLNHTITRPTTREGNRPGPFIDRYVFPDGELQSPGTIITEMHDNGLEVRHSENLREHYAMTLREWGRNLERHWDRAVAEVGERRARVWRLYMAISRVGFDTGRIQIHQFLGVRATAEGGSGMPLRPTWGTSRSAAPNRAVSS